MKFIYSEVLNIYSLIYYKKVFFNQIIEKNIRKQFQCILVLFSLKVFEL